MPVEYGVIVSLMVSTAEAKGRTGQIKKPGVSEKTQPGVTLVG